MRLCCYNNYFSVLSLCISDTISAPPINYPLINNCGYVGHLLNILTCSRSTGFYKILTDIWT